MDVEAQKTQGRPDISSRELFAGFFEIAASSFGGALAWARRVVVDRRRWLTEREFTEMLGVCQVLPGGNVFNLAICLGTRSRGGVGALAAIGGLVLPPLVVMLVLGVLYDYGAQIEPLRNAMHGAAAAAVGLLVATGIRMALPYRGQWMWLAVIALAFVAVGVLRLPLIPVILVVGSLSVAIAWRTRR